MRGWQGHPVLQSELAAATAANRARLAPLLEAVRRDLPAQRAAALEREAQTELIKDYITVLSCGHRTHCIQRKYHQIGIYIQKSDLQ